MKGVFIAVEGVEGAGKSSVCNYLEKKLRDTLNTEVVRVREPGGTPVAEALRQILITPTDKEHIHPKTELLLMVAARNQLLEERIKPALKKGHCVIGDRHALSSYAYQGAGRGLGIELVDALHKLCFADFKPHLTLYLDVSPEVGLARVSKRGEKDRIEQEAISFFKTIRHAYLSLVDEVNAVLIDCEQPIDKVFLAVDEAINTRLAHVK